MNHLQALGYEFVFETELTVVFKRGNEVFTFKNPNQGHITEMMINDALGRAGLPIPAWDVTFGIE